LYKVVLLVHAEKFYRKLLHSQPMLFKRIDNALESLKTEPFKGKPLKDNLKGKCSLRVGDYRIIYSVEKHIVTVYVFDIGHRREIYR